MFMTSPRQTCISSSFLAIKAIKPRVSAECDWRRWAHPRRDRTYARIGGSRGCAQGTSSAGTCDSPDIHPNVSGIYRKKVERLSEALNNPRIAMRRQKRSGR